MKALSVQQPYAAAIAAGVKTIEFRSRPIHYRGELLICTTKGGETIWCEDNGRYYKWPKGAHACVVEVVGCHPATADDAEAGNCYPEDIPDGAWAWEIKLKRLVKPNPVSGKLNLFEVADTAIEDDDDSMDYHLQFEEVSETEPKTGIIL